MRLFAKEWCMYIFLNAQKSENPVRSKCGKIPTRRQNVRNITYIVLLCIYCIQIFVLGRSTPCELLPPVAVEDSQNLKHYNVSC